MNSQTLKALALAVPLAVTGCKTTEVVTPPNPGSHHWSWVASSLLPGRTVILFDKVNYRADWKNWFVTRAVYHTRPGFHGGRTLSCEGEKRRYSEVRFDGSYFSWEGHDDTYAAVGSESGYRAPLFFDVRSGRFHIEDWYERSGKWLISADGWVQEGWPRLMADACPGITEEILADGGRINEKQTHPTIYRMLEQDPTAPLVLPHMSPDHRIGIAAEAAMKRPDPAPWHWCFKSPSKPVLPDHCFPDGVEAPDAGDTSRLLPESADEAHDHLQRLALADTLRAAQGNVLEDRLGRSYVLALGPTDELWAVDGEGHLTDVGYLSWNVATETLELDWELKDEAANYHHRPGDPLPVIDTGRPHPLFAIADWLVAAGDDVVLPYMGRPARFRFDEGGALTVRGKEHDFGGRWRVSRGRLIIEVDGITEHAAYRWDLLAGHLRATTGYTG